MPRAAARQFPGPAAPAPARQLEERIRAAATARDFEQLVREFTKPLTAEAKRGGKPARAPPKPGRASRISRLYRANRAKAVREILEGPSRACPIPLQELQEYFTREQPAGTSPPAGLPRLLPVGCHKILEKPFTRGEVSAQLKGARNTAPGPDGIPYGLLKKRDPGCPELAAIFNGCKRFGRTPSAWKKAITIFVYKSGDEMDPSSWRPITLGNTMPKLYAKCLAARIARWAESGQALSPQQGLEASELRFLLRSAWLFARSQGRECAVAWLDFANAFGSVSHRHVFETLEKFGMPPGFLGLLREFYRGCTTTVKTKAGKTAEIPLQRGLSQGCPLSSILFALAMEPLLRFIHSRSPGFRLHGTKVSILAYVDDLVLVAENAPQLQKMLDDAAAAAAWMGLSFNAKKCKSFHFKGEEVYATKFTIRAEDMASLESLENVQYLGMPVGFQGQAKSTIRDFERNVNKITRSQLGPWQKADMLKKSLLPRIASVLREQAVAKEDLRRVDIIIANALSMWTPYDQRGTAVQKMDERAAIEVVTHAFLMLTSPDEVVQAVAHGALRDTVKSFIEEPSEEDLALFLSGSQENEFPCTSGGSTFLWIRARDASRQLNELIGCQWTYYNGELCVEVSQRLISPKERKTLVRTLKDAVNQKKHPRGTGNH